MKSNPGKILVTMVSTYLLILLFGTYGLHSWALTLDGDMGYYLFFSPVKKIYDTHKDVYWLHPVEAGREMFDQFKNLTFISPPSDVAAPDSVSDPDPKPKILPEPEEILPLFKGDQLDVLVLGDSMANSVGKQLGPLINEYPDMTCRVEGVISSNLIRLDYYDWIHEAPRIAGEEAYDCVILFLGANTMQSFYLEGKKVSLFSQEWLEIYGDRAKELIDNLNSLNLDVIWMTLPPMRKESYHKNIMYLDTVIDQICRQQKIERMSYNKLITTEKGEYLSEIVVEDKQILLRHDGIHFTSEGAAYVSNYIIGLIREKYGLGDVEIREIQP